jgi:hypothetical protein
MSIEMRKDTIPYGLVERRPQGFESRIGAEKGKRPTTRELYHHTIEHLNFGSQVFHWSSPLFIAVHSEGSPSN